MNWEVLLSKRIIQGFLLCIICLPLVVILYNCYESKKDIETGSLIVLEKTAKKKTKKTKKKEPVKELELVSAEVNEWGNTILTLRYNGASRSNLEITFESNGPGGKRTVSENVENWNKGEVKSFPQLCDSGWDKEFNRYALTCKITIRNKNDNNKKEFKFEWR